MKYIIIILLLTGCATSPQQEVINAFSDIRDNCYLVAIELQRRMGDGWYVVTLEKDGIDHAVTCGDYCMDNGYISTSPFAESLLTEQGWTFKNVEQFRYVR